MEIKRGTEVGIKDSHWFALAACQDCGRERWVRLKGDKLASKRCHSCSTKALGMTGSKSPMWKGGRTRDKRSGYVHIKLISGDFFFPMGDALRYVMEHRLVMARSLNRCLLPWEIVHHKNGIKDDNRLENLELLPSQHIHNSISRLIKYIRKLEKELGYSKNDKLY